MVANLTSAVLYHLRDGLGADDIALLTDHPPADVRQEISILRATGILTTLYEGARAAWRAEAS